jgi:hypothetical protein
MAGKAASLFLLILLLLSVRWQRSLPPAGVAWRQGTGFQVGRGVEGLMHIGNEEMHFKV